MSILIPNKEMPSCCNDCFAYYDGYCKAAASEDEWSKDVSYKTYCEKREDYCPLKTITIDDIMTPICEDYCKHLGEYKDPDDLWNNECDKCKLVEMMEKLLDES